MKDIDYALVEEKRPAIYTAMKYWGKKPHNIWRSYIENYSENGMVLDPFAGSAISAFESVKAGKKAIALDLNPLTSFIIEVYSTNFDYTLFKKSVERIVAKVSDDSLYKEYYSALCPKCGEPLIIQSFKWENGKIYECGVICNSCHSRSTISPSAEQISKSKLMDSIVIPFWFPHEEFHRSPSFSDSFKVNIGKTYDRLWTKRNLYVLSFIFDEILKERNEEIKLQLLFGFIQSVHLCSKMCVPRREKANRAFSTSWGRSAYFYSKRQMEMNPLFVFENNCLGKQSVKSALENIPKHLGKIPIVQQITKKFDFESNKDWDILYGIVDIKKIRDYIPEKSVSFIITDPPYGGLVQYLDLSCIWLVWLKKYNKKYTPNIDQEITIKKGIKSLETYNKDFTRGIKNLYNVLKDDGKIVFTFHNKDLMVWNAFLRSLSESGFKVERVIHQQNKRTGESNVANPYGTSASDFYIRCTKSPVIKKEKTTKEEFEKFIIEKTLQIIKERNEPTPYQILFNGILSELSKAGFDLENFDENLIVFLKKHTNDIFEITQTHSVIGNLWWIRNYDAKSSKVVPLSERVDITIKNLFNEKEEVTIDDVLAELFIKYPNGLTPDIRNLERHLLKHAKRSGNKWVKK